MEILFGLVGIIIGAVVASVFWYMKEEKIRQAINDNIDKGQLGINLIDSKLDKVVDELQTKIGNDAVNAKIDELQAKIDDFRNEIQAKIDGFQK